MADSTLESTSKARLLLELVQSECFRGQLALETELRNSLLMKLQALDVKQSPEALAIEYVSTKSKIDCLKEIANTRDNLIASITQK
jgi:hypothetical protein